MDAIEFMRKQKERNLSGLREVNDKPKDKDLYLQLKEISEKITEENRNSVGRYARYGVFGNERSYFGLPRLITLLGMAEYLIKRGTFSLEYEKSAIEKSGINPSELEQLALSLYDELQDPYSEFHKISMGAYKGTSENFRSSLHSLALNAGKNGKTAKIFGKSKVFIELVETPFYSPKGNLYDSLKSIKKPDCTKLYSLGYIGLWPYITNPRKNVRPERYYLNSRALESYKSKDYFSSSL